MKRAHFILLVLAVLATCGFLLMRSSAQSSADVTITVTSTADSGPGTLRQALLDAQSGDTILFDTAAFSPSAPATIYVTSELPHVSQGDLTIDASNAGVILDGGGIPGDWVNGLQIYSGGNIIRGLQIVNFTGSGIVLCGGSYNTIGGNRSIGAGPLGQGNLTSKNGIGIDLCTTGSYNAVAGNIVGTDPTHSDGWGNKQAGIWIENGMTHNTVGPDNIIAHNDTFGIVITGSDTFGIVVTQNSIHDNGSTGISLQDGGNTELAAPWIADFDLDAGTIGGATCANCTVEIFSDSSDEGEVYEGQTTADGLGAFAFNKGSSFTGPHLTATTTDPDGNTSEFSLSTSGSLILQEGNNFPRTSLQPRQSRELEDNRIGIFFNNLWKPVPEAFPEGVLDASYVLEQGVKRVRLAINNLEANNPQNPINWDKPELSIDPNHDDLITNLADNDMTMTYVLSFWDKAYRAAGGEIPIPRFKTEDEIQRYVDFVRFIVRHFKDRIQYYEIWNEPDSKDTVQAIEVEDYINLVKRAVPVIRQEYPEARIQVGGTMSPSNPESREYLFSILRSDIMPLVDVVSWHPMPGTSPEYEHDRQYYYEYPSLVQEIKDGASAHGFKGEYEGDELMWYTPEYVAPSHGNVWPHSETKCAKYYARGIVMHLGMDVAVSQFNHSAQEVQIVRTIQNLNTTMAGNRPMNLPVTIQSDATNIKSYGFSLSNGDKLFALWTDGVAVDDDPGVEATLTFAGLSDMSVIGIDVLNGFEQQLLTSSEGGNLVIRNLLVKDYPIILRLQAGVATSFAQGWNHVCHVQSEQPIEEALADITGDVQAVYRLSAGQSFDRWFPSRPEVSNIATIKPYEPLFVLMGKDTAWSQTPSDTPPNSVSLLQGWNGTCYLGRTMAAEDATEGIASQLGMLYMLGSDQVWSRHVPDRPEVSDIAQLAQYDAVLLLVNAEGGAQWVFSP